MESTFLTSEQTQGLPVGVEGPTAGPMSDVVAELLTNKHVLAETAAKQFGAWDADKNAYLDVQELAQVTYSDTAPAEQRAAAEILSKNFDLARNISVTQMDLPSYLSTPTASNRYMDYFASDKTEAGISLKDITALKMLSSAGGMEEFTKSVETDEKGAAVIDGIITGASAIATAIGIGLLFKGASKAIASAGKVPLEDKAFAGLALGGVGGVHTLAFGKTAYNDLLNSGVPQLEEQFKRRQEMLNSWTKPV